MPPHTLTSRLLLLLVISFSTIDQALGKQISMPQSLLELQHSPAPYECAVLSGHVYQDALQEGDPVVWMDPNTQQVHALHGWAVYKVLGEIPLVYSSNSLFRLGGKVAKPYLSLHSPNTKAQDRHILYPQP